MLPASTYKLLGAVGGVIVAVVLMNVLGYLIEGTNPSYNSAQGGASRYFMLSILAAPVGGIIGGIVGHVLASRRIPPHS